MVQPFSSLARYCVYLFSFSLVLIIDLMVVFFLNPLFGFQVKSVINLLFAAYTGDVSALRR